MCTRSVGLISLKAWESNLVALARNSLITSLYDTHPRPSSLTKPPPRTSHFVVSTPSGVEERLLPLLYHPNPIYYGFLNCLISQCTASSEWHARDAVTPKWAWRRSAQASAHHKVKPRVVLNELYKLNTCCTALQCYKIHETDQHGKAYRLASNF
jgi:hypothetical protein